MLLVLEIGILGCVTVKETAVLRICTFQGNMHGDFDAPMNSDAGRMMG